MATSHPLSLIQLNPEVTAPVALPDRIYATLKHRVLTCSMLPGSRVVEKELCTEMRVSRTPLREALNRLALEGLVTITPYRGYAVAPLTVEGFRELCEVRRILEAEAAALAAERGTEEDLRKLESLAQLRYRQEDRRTYGRYLRANSAFHQALVQCTRNQRLEVMVMSALDQHQRPLYLGLGVGVDGKASTEEHLEVVAAIRSRNAIEARKVVTQHIIRAEGRIATALTAAGY
ncbi:MAG TPA: GntR family transcriptional regulator [Vicinamibacterales bacterium]|nr:GntR family transcriptional regulator [Vicinamibacterales bacterium]